MRALHVSMVQHVETKVQATRVNVLMGILVIDVILEVSLFLNTVLLQILFKTKQDLALRIPIFKVTSYSSKNVSSASKNVSATMASV